MHTEHRRATESIYSAAIAILIILGFEFGVYAALETPSGDAYGTIPESLERIMFLCFVGGILPAAYIGSWVAKAINKGAQPSPVSALILASTALVELVGITGSWKELSQISYVRSVYASILFQFSLAFFVALSAAAILHRRNRHSHAATNWIIFSVSTVVAVSVIVSFRIYPDAAVDHTFQKVSHLEAVLYSVSQVVAGKTALVDFPVQYGLYSEFISPLLKLIGPSILNFTIIMAVMQSIATMSVIAVVVWTIRSIEIRVICVLSLLMLLGYTWLAPLDTYFQYFPIRFFFSAVGTLLYWIYLQRSSSTVILLLGALCGLAVPFNLDSGVPILGSCGAGMLFAFLFAAREQRRAKGTELVFFCLAAGASMTSFVTTFYINGVHLNWMELAKYQMLFYIVGAYGLPMPHSINLWTVVLGVYAIGVVAYIYTAINFRSDLTMRLIFQISVLGIGLFSYYQGRSHIIVLSMAAWPAILLIFLFADRTLRAANTYVIRPSGRLTVIPSMLLGVALSSGLVGKIPIFFSAAKSNFEAVVAPQSTQVLRSIAFIEGSHPDKNSTVIVAPHQSVYYLETGLGSAVPGPGIAETLSPVDRQDFIKRVLTGHVADVFFKSDSAYLGREYLEILKGPYRVVATSADGMEHLVPLGPPQALTGE